MPFQIVGRPVNPIGYGTLGLFVPKNNISEDQAISLLKAALYAGANFWNVSSHYGKPNYNILHILNAYFTKYPEDAEKVVISLRGGVDPSRSNQVMVDAVSMRTSIEEYLKIADGKFRIDIFAAGRLDPNVPVEETVSAIAEYVKAGKIGGVGLSECSGASIRRAVKVTSIAAVEVELSLFETGIYHNGVADACKEFGIPIVAYSPISRGFLNGKIRKYADMAEDDYRRMFPRFHPDVFDNNMKLVEETEMIAKKNGCTTVQAGLAWVCAQSAMVGVPVIPIPGSTGAAHIQANTKPVELSKEEIEELDAILGKIEVKGARAPAGMTQYLEV